MPARTRFVCSCILSDLSRNVNSVTCLLILVVTCAEVAIAIVYHYLDKGDWRWWWRAWLATGCSAVYFFAYAVVFYHTRLEAGPKPWATPVLYFGWMALAAAAFALFTGAVGALSAFFFVRLIYGSVEEERCRIAARTFHETSADICGDAERALSREKVKPPSGSVTPEEQVNEIAQVTRERDALQVKNEIVELEESGST